MSNRARTPPPDERPPWLRVGAALAAVLTAALVRRRRRPAPPPGSPAGLAAGRLAAIVGSSDDAVISKTLDGVIVSWNAGAERLFGYPAAEAIGRPITMLIPPEQPQEEAAILRRIRRGERVAPYETVRLRRDGQRVDVSVSVSPIRDAAGRIVGASTIARDVTERKQMERALARERELLQRIVERIPVMIALYRPDTRVLRLNAEFERVTGWSTEEAARVDLMAQCYPDPAYREMVRGFMDSTRPGWLDIDMTARDGSVVATSWSNIRLPDDTRVGIGIDIRERRHAEQERERLLAREQAARAQAEALARAASMLITALDPDALAREIVTSVCRLLAAQAAVCATFEPGGEPGGEPGDDPAGRSRAALVVRAVSGDVGSYWRPGVRVPEGMGQMWYAIREGRPVRTEDLLQDPEIGWSPEMRAGVEAAPYRAALAVPLAVEGRVIGAIGIGDRRGRVFTDDDVRLVSAFAAQAAIATENARLYRTIEAAGRAKDEFLAMLGHELRNPLGAISSAVGVLNQVGSADERLARPREIISRQVRLLSRLVDDLLDVARLQSGKITLQREPLDLRELAERCVGQLAAGERLQGRRLSVTGERALVAGDPTRLEQVVTNLLDNAVKYTPADGEIAVRVERAGGQAVLRVRDTGIGIPADVLPVVFEPFTQVERSLDRARGGLGLGLALVRRLVELHGGQVSAASEGPGRGSELVVRLPLARAAALRPAPAAAAPAPARHVGIVEDNADAREALRILLESHGHRVDVAADGPAGLAMLLAARPEVALIDVGLPVLDGYALARRVRASPGGAAIRLIALTGYGQPEDRRRALDAGFDAHLVKPVEEAALLGLLAEPEDRPAPRRQAGA